ncbi:expressed protein [Dictyostelium purpureum]|uniref:Expressed protein n=1 Tax=Dictyostelium purpureum TaxID=5786 RepID=F0ZMV5_DICPU|nr:uncharacterized protein DICPUDRAFT_92156 [Dictyostelium purpureum]EGC34707.1 expressed protein [Dictyostelium purpureum]|eukprot:XP_003288748.1 expressed protein [Dictyostelium purpureum]
MLFKSLISLNQNNKNNQILSNNTNSCESNKFNNNDLCASNSSLTTSMFIKPYFMN